MNSQNYPLITAQQTVTNILIIPKKYRDVLNLCGYFTVEKKPNLDAIEKAFNYIIEEQEALRLQYVRRWGKITQYISDYEYYKIPVVELTSENELEQVMSDTHQTNDLFKGLPLYDATIYTYGNPQKATLYMRFSHFCFDAFSYSILTEDLIKYYDALKDGEEPTREKIGASWTKIVERELKYETSSAQKRDIEYWSKRLNEAPIPSNVYPPLKIASPLTTHTIEIKGEQYEKLRKWESVNEAPRTFFYNMVAGLLLGKRSGENKFAIGVYHHGRSSVDEYRTIGLLSSAIISMISLDRNQSLVDCTKENFIDYFRDMQHRNVNSKEFSRQARSRKAKKINKFFANISISHIGMEVNQSSGDYRIGMSNNKNLPFSSYEYISDNKKDSATITILYQKEMLPEAKIRDVFNDVEIIIDSVLNNPEQKVGDVIGY